ncbi:MAG: hypothetical protein JSR83_26280 [Proteobacteria bacterium]|nr:hypothetical protein [Pseudomonadota bacterium]
MSSAADIVHDLAALVQALAALLETKTAREIPNIARDLGAQPQLAQGVDALGQVLGEIRAGAVPLRRTALDADALVALLGCIPGFVNGIGAATDASGDWLARLGIGLGDAASAALQVSGPLRQVSGVLDMGAEVAEGAVSLLAPAEWRGLISALDHLSEALKALKTPAPTTPASAMPGAALSGG